MIRLNIPLERGKQTTRHPRRVVWHDIAYVCIVVFIFLFLGNMWFTRNTISNITPENTWITLRFTPNQFTWGTISDILANTAIITDRDITINDLKPYINGEFALFIKKDGSTSIAIRSQQKQIPREILDSNSIFSDESKNSGTVLLSNKQEQTYEAKFSKPWFYFIPTWSKKLGTVYISDDNFHTKGLILQDKSNFIIRISGKSILEKQSEKNITEEIASFSLNTLLLSNSSIPDLFQKLKTIVINNNDSLGVLLEFDKNLISNNQLQEIINQYSLQQSIKTKNWLLPDGTIAKEMLTNVSSISEEEIVVNGKSLIKIQPSTNSELLMYNNETTTVLSNNENLIGLYLENPNRTKTKSCKGNIGHINIEGFDKFNKITKTMFSPQTISSTFESIGINSRLLFTDFTFCNEQLNDSSIESS
ncbi:MAG: hypothetical protein ABIH21_04335 [Patescibacteria group bacterium]